ncbi:MAG: mevalonate kinase [Desulfobacteraceae bacterium 4484_190.2]|nr:MAG: mevalonate kinase [Desulfobacteraceae bacterium 4484_190.2]
MGRGTGFGKTILIGDQFVLYGVPAVVSALPYETVADVKRVDGEGWILEDNRREVPGYKEKKKEQQVESINRILEVMKIDVKNNPIKITYGGTLLAGSGVGASAASCVSLARALSEEFSLGLSVEEINRVGWEGEFAYHGTPSGVDNTASTYGGIMLYQIKNDQKKFERISLKKSIEVVLGNSGVTADTSLLDGFVMKEKDQDQELFSTRLKTITDQAYEVKKGLEEGDLEKVGKTITKNHEILIEMGLSHEKLISLCNLALKKGALGAKLTGGGMGGYMIALTPGKELQETVASAIEKQGCGVIRATIGSKA